MKENSLVYFLHITPLNSQHRNAYWDTEFTIVRTKYTCLDMQNVS